MQNSDSNNKRPLDSKALVGTKRPVQSEEKSTSEKSASIVRWNENRDEWSKIRPTIETYGAWQFGFEHFNTRLFDGRLPDPVITLTRNPRMLGYFWPNKFQNKSGLLTHEISQNPSYLKPLGDEFALSVLVHEMVHLWREVFGTENPGGGKGSDGYHDLVWARKMEDIGLMPTSTGLPGGKKTGYRVSHMIIKNGLFDRACQELLASGYKIDWHDSDSSTRSEDIDGRDAKGGINRNTRRKKDRLKFTCRSCGLNAWAKPSAKLTCTNCAQPMCPNVQPNGAESRAIMCSANASITRLTPERNCPACGSPWVDENGNYSICKRCPHYIPPVTDDVERSQANAQLMEATGDAREEARSDRSYFDFLMTG